MGEPLTFRQWQTAHAAKRDVLRWWRVETRWLCRDIASIGTTLLEVTRQAVAAMNDFATMLSDMNAVMASTPVLFDTVAPSEETT